MLKTHSKQKGMALLLSLVFLSITMAVTLALASTVAIRPQTVKSQLFYMHNKRLADDAVNYAIRELNTRFRDHRVTDNAPAYTASAQYTQIGGGYGSDSVNVRYGYNITQVHRTGIRQKLNPADFPGVAYTVPDEAMLYYVYKITGYACVDDGANCSSSNPRYKVHAYRLYERFFQKTVSLSDTGGDTQRIRHCQCG